MIKFIAALSILCVTYKAVPKEIELTYEVTIDKALRTELYQKCKKEKLADGCHYWSFERSRVIVATVVP